MTATPRTRIPAAFAITFTTLLAGCATGPRARPKAVDTYVAGARAYQAGDKDKALATLVSAIDQNPDLVMARSITGDIYRSRGDYKDAAAQYEALTRLDPYTPANHYYLGLCYQFLNRFADAAASYLRALQLNPKDARSSTSLGSVYLMLGQIDDALRYLQRATEQDPNNADAWANYAAALDARQDYPKAETAYRKSLELNSDQPATLINFGTNLILQGRPQEAVNILQQAVQKSDTPLAHQRLGDAYAANKKYDDAIKQYEAALKLDPNYYPAMNEQARVLIAQYRAELELDDAKRKRALDLWKKSLALKPDQPKIKQWMQEVEKRPLFNE